MSNRKSKTKSIALERVFRLLNLAEENFDKRPELSNQYVEQAWKIKTRYNLKLPSSIKRKFCRKCQTFWVPGETCRVRLRPSRPPHLSITCLNCGYIKRIPYKEKK